MAFQETGSCSTAPYKCLNIISSELYNSLIEKSKCCDHDDDDGNSPTSNASANSSPSPLRARMWFEAVTISRSGRKRSINAKSREA